MKPCRIKSASECQRALAHTTVITMLNIMHEKGFLKRRKDGKSFRSAPKVDQQRVRKGMMGHLLALLFNNSPAKLMLNLLENSDLNAEEVAQIRELLSRKSSETSK